QLPHLNDLFHALELPPKSQLQNGWRPTLEWTFPAAIAQQQEIIRAVTTDQKHPFDSNFVDKVRVIPSTGRNAAKLEFQLHPQAFVENLLRPSATSTYMQGQEHVVVEYSSPNIAKPFHVGHLRSTIIGNVLANIHQHLGYRTTRLNYLGDWGTQFGLLALGVQLNNVADKEMEVSPIETMYKAYVAANKAARSDPDVALHARALFSALEAGADEAMTKKWKQYRQYTLEELSKVYSRLGVHFDSYEWESQYSQQQCQAVLESMRHGGLLHRDPDGREVIVVDGRRIPVIKSDGSTLYLARDIVALLERLDRFQFSRILYVVDNSQTDHFNALFKTALTLNGDLNQDQLQHVKFGRIHGMSTRQGKAIFLKDVLDEARQIMREKRKLSETTRKNFHFDDENVCDILGVSAVLVNVLKQRRQRDHEFSWQQALQVNGDTGIKLQYTHSRLHSLLDKFGDVDLENIKPDWNHFKQEPVDAMNVLFELARFDQSVWQAKKQLEACVLVNYLFGLCNATSRALKRLPVKQENCKLKQSQRLLLFHASKRTIQQGMRLLGLRPLDQM
ncbi:hypothetical protein KR018_004263, partial [Drosophila ironensis]